MKHSSQPNCSRESKNVSLPAFQQALPIWLKGRSGVWNQMAGFLLSWESSDSGLAPLLRITGADCYRVWCNGRHAGYGPARAAHGFSRVDEWPLQGLIQEGENHLAIEVASCGIDSYAYAMQPPFLQAEVRIGDTVLAATGEDSKARPLTERVQKVERFSKQRPFAEAYRLTPGCQDWRIGGDGRRTSECELVDQPQLLPRWVRRPNFDCVQALAVMARGRVVQQDPVPPIPRSAQRDGVGKRVMGYPVDELEIDMTAELNQMAFREDSSEALSINEAAEHRIEEGSFRLYDFGIVQGGFLGIRLQCEQPGRVYLAFDEILDKDEHLYRFRMGIGAIALDLQPGSHEFESMEPYTFRFLRVIAVDAAIAVEAAWVREYAHPAADAMACPADPELAKIFQAARQTFRTNSIDLFTDCMSRERGGYPCDSWFTGRAERVLAGESRVERNFLENYFLIDKFSSIPRGMVPHCYPSDRLGKGQYIPNWGLWLVLELCAFYGRTGDEALRDLARPGVEALFDWFAPCLNEIGLLEDIPGWVFVEWSRANDCTSGVNHPTNMLYAQCLAEAAALYERPVWAEQAEIVRAGLRRESWNGRWFSDQSLRVDGKLQPGDVQTETCQYHALYFGIAEKDEYDRLWSRLRDNWGAGRSRRPKDLLRPEEGELAPANLLYGLMLRFDLLQRYEEWDRLLDELRLVFGPQAERTGTLWEHIEPNSSCNHGFASCAAEYLASALEAGENKGFPPHTKR